jgi:putative colanic acid biosynthesis acetyltransferase WcaF
VGRLSKVSTHRFRTERRRRVLPSVYSSCVETKIFSYAGDICSQRVALGDLVTSIIDLSVSDKAGYTIGRPRYTLLLWYFVGSPLMSSYWLPFSAFKVFILRLFGANIGKGVYLKPGIKVKFPWRLTVGDYSWIGEDAWIDNMAEVSIGSHACVSQGAYLCTGNHDWASPCMKLFTRPVRIGDGAWVAARSTVCPGVTVGNGAILTVASVAGKSIPPLQVWSGSPATYSRDRVIES